MSGCFYNSGEDAHFERQLNRYLDSCSRDEEEWEEIVKQMGEPVLDDGEGFAVWKCRDGSYVGGNAYIAIEADPDGEYATVKGTEDVEVVFCKTCTIVKSFKRVPSKRMSVKRWYGKTKKVVNEVRIFKD